MISPSSPARRARTNPTPIAGTPAAPILPTDNHVRSENQPRSVVGGQPFDLGEESDATDSIRAEVDHSASSDQERADTHPTDVAAGDSEANPQHTSESVDGWLQLRVWAEMFDDAQKARIANVNRAERGGADPDIFAAHIESLIRTEHACRLAMRRTFRRIAPPSIIEWQKATNGIGPDLLPRLLGHLGHPRWATPHHWEGTGSSRVLITDPPFERSVGQLWQYAGHGAPARRSKGMSAADLASQGSPMVKMLVHLNAEACMKCMSSPFRLVYEQARQDVADKTHTVECVRCGPSGKPAQPGSPWSPGHQNAHALRIVGKEILRDLWAVSL